ncbi:MAG: hypothetical protein Edafosvirus23_13 [Edafosvirus sp.]|uniref:Uncharacterized protein n=1 Tax=Edafosvirus sp. TaxID=2487765 RepID=A0A3G4ZWE2_9VIRU|nr:MAG: hypothetical protein Edafosvirus23_13 [Edafosvirus sp.]
MYQFTQISFYGSRYNYYVTYSEPSYYIPVRIPLYGELNGYACQCRYNLWQSRYNHLMRDASIISRLYKETEILKEPVQSKETLPEVKPETPKNNETVQIFEESIQNIINEYNQKPDEKEEKTNISETKENTPLEISDIELIDTTKNEEASDIVENYIPEAPPLDPELFANPTIILGTVQLESPPSDTQTVSTSDIKITTPSDTNVSINQTTDQTGLYNWISSFFG